MFEKYKEMGFTRITDPIEFRRLDRLATAFLANASLGRFSVDDVELMDYFIFLDEFASADKKQSEMLSGFRNDNYQESYATQTKQESDSQLLVTAIGLFGSAMFYRGVSLC